MDRKSRLSDILKRYATFLHFQAYEKTTKNLSENDLKLE